MPNSIYSYQSIDPTECMGDSLTKINNNNFLADGAIGTLETRIVSVSSNLNTRITSLSTVPYARLNDGNQSGVAPIFGARAWVNFDGNGTTGTPQTIRSQGNVSSVIKNNNGIYTITFATPMNNANYCVIGSGNQYVPGAGNITVSTYWVNASAPNNKTVNAVQICTLDTDLPNFSATDVIDCNVVIFG